MTKTNFQSDAIFWVEVDKISPNPYQPRREFTEDGLRELAESIRMHGILQPLTVTRREVQSEDGMSVEYELIAGERRLRASKLAGLVQVPVIIRSGPESSRIKLELAIIENLQREDLNPVDRAVAFKQLADEFEFTHSQIAKKVGKSREYVSNSIRLLQLPEGIQKAIMQGKISEGHARPLGMLRDKPEEQTNVFREVVLKKLTVRETEKIARGIAKDKVRKKDNTLGPELERFQKELSQTLGTRVHIEPREVGGKLVIDYFSQSDVKNLLDLVNASITEKMNRSDDEDKSAVSSEAKLTETRSEHKTADAPDNIPSEQDPSSMDDTDVNQLDDPFDYLNDDTSDSEESGSIEKSDDVDPFAYLGADSHDDTAESKQPFSPVSELLEPQDQGAKAEPQDDVYEPKKDSASDADQFGLGSFSV